MQIGAKFGKNFYDLTGSSQISIIYSFKSMLVVACYALLKLKEDSSQFLILTYEIDLYLNVFGKKSLIYTHFP